MTGILNDLYGKVPGHIKSSYLGIVLHVKSLPILVDIVLERIKKTNICFDTIAFTGQSGALVAPLLAIKMGKNLLMVRKEHDVSHSFSNFEGYFKIKNYIILDDLISTGNTVKRVYKQIHEQFPCSSLSAIVLYRDDGNYYPRNGFDIDNINFPVINLWEKSPV
jgi:orotate phosphoribosyltransferase-like protein